ncbi:MAG: hypothetical protein WC284_18370 [Candidimonas sp.]
MEDEFVDNSGKQLSRISRSEFMMIMVPSFFASCDPNMFQQTIDNKNLLIMAFSWGSTAEGFKYWVHIYRNGHTDESVNKIYEMIKLMDQFEFTANTLQLINSPTRIEIPINMTCVGQWINGEVKVSMGDYQISCSSPYAGLVVLRNLYKMSEMTMIDMTMNDMKLIETDFTILTTYNHVWLNGCQI